jgi:hypothetical protein
MTITRVQQVAGVLSGTSDTITLPATPQYGSTLIAVFARAGTAPIATSLTQPNVTWTSLASGSNGSTVSHHVFYAQGVTTAAGTTITVTRGDTDDYVYAVFEYAGLLRFGTLLDQSVTASQDGQSPYTPATPATTQAQELFLGALANALPGTTAVLQHSPNNGFAIVSQSSAADAETADVNLAVVEKLAAAVDTPSVTTQTDDWVVWNTRLLTLLADLSTVVRKQVALDQYIADDFEVSAVLSPVIAETHEPTVDLEVQIQPVIGCVLDVFVGGLDVLFCNLDVLLQLAVEAQLDMYLVGTVEQTADLSVTVGIQTFPVQADMNLTVAAEDLRLSSKLDLAVLVPPPLVNVLTTPEASRYLECRSLWCNVPKVRAVTSRYDVSVGGYGELDAQLNLHIETGFTRLAWMQVFIAPEP